jgi:hypothetical protein
MGIAADRIAETLRILMGAISEPSGLDSPAVG